MRVGSKGRYAVKAIIFLAQQDQRTPMSLSDISKLHEISLSYLEQLFSKLRQAGVVKSVRGPGGGYILRKSPDRIKISEIIEAVEMSTVKSELDRSQTGLLWDALGYQVLGFLQSISVADVCESRIDVLGIEKKQNPETYAIAR